MAIPITPGGNMTPPPPKKQSARSEVADDALPEIEFDSVTEPRIERQAPQRKPAPSPKPHSEPREVRQPKPSKPKVTPRVEETTERQVEEELPEGWAIDKKTGKKYKLLPKTQYDDDGLPMLQVEDFDDLNLNNEAERFLAHLRVAPDREEQKRLREKRAQMQKESNKKYTKITQELSEKYDD